MDSRCEIPAERSQLSSVQMHKLSKVKFHPQFWNILSKPKITMQNQRCFQIKISWVLKHSESSRSLREGTQESLNKVHLVSVRDLFPLFVLHHFPFRGMSTMPHGRQHWVTVEVAMLLTHKLVSSKEPWTYFISLLWSPYDMEVKYWTPTNKQIHCWRKGLELT